MICALPLGLVYCGHPDTPAAIDDAQAGDSDDAAAGQDRRPERVTAFRRNLGARVEAGEITRSQAEAEMAALLARMAAVGEQAEARIGDAVGAAEGAAGTKWWCSRWSSVCSGFACAWRKQPCGAARRMATGRAGRGPRQRPEVPVNAPPVE